MLQSVVQQLAYSCIQEPRTFSQRHLLRPSWTDFWEDQPSPSCWASYLLDCEHGCQKQRPQTGNPARALRTSAATPADNSLTLNRHLQAQARRNWHQLRNLKRLQVPASANTDALKRANLLKSPDEIFKSM